MTILVIEDEKKTYESVKRILEFEHYTVEVATDGKEGLEKAELNDYDVIILDRMLPKMDGISIITTASLTPAFDMFVLIFLFCSIFTYSG
jgi:DNA-binding response OmpR family regulator